jgi:hypothetical protein
LRSPPVAYTNIEGREGLLGPLGEATDEVGATLAFIAAAHEQVDDRTADRLEETLFAPTQRAYGRAKRTHAEFAARHGLSGRGFSPPAEPPAALRARDLIENAATTAERVDETLATLQDDQALVELGDVELRSGIAAVRADVGVVPRRARELLRMLGR